MVRKLYANLVNFPLRTKLRTMDKISKYAVGCIPWHIYGKIQQNSERPFRIEYCRNPERQFIDKAEKPSRTRMPACREASHLMHRRPGHRKR